MQTSFRSATFGQQETWHLKLESSVECNSSKYLHFRNEFGGGIFATVVMASEKVQKQTSSCNLLYLLFYNNFPFPLLQYQHSTEPN